MKKILILLYFLPVLLWGQTNTQNYIKTRVYREATTQTNEALAKVTITYYDGLGRPMQTIAVNSGGDGEDIIIPIVYDELGRQSRQYLPYADPAQTVSSQEYRDNATLVNTTLPNRYLQKFPQDVSSSANNPYSETFYEASPLTGYLNRQHRDQHGWEIRLMIMTTQ